MVAKNKQNITTEPEITPIRNRTIKKCSHKKLNKIRPPGKEHLLGVVHSSKITLDKIKEVRTNNTRLFKNDSQTDKKLKR